MLEDLALQIGLIQQTLSPTLHKPHNILLAGDHGIVEEGVSKSPKEVTWQQLSNFTHGGGGVNFLCRQHHFELVIVDAGVDYDLPYEKGIVNLSVGRGTKNFLHGPAMTEEERDLCIERGASIVDKVYESGCNIVSFGEMGIGNTSPSSIWMHLLANIPLKDCVGAGSGLDATGVQHKRDVLQAAVDRFRGEWPAGCPVPTLVRSFAGLEMAAAIGAMLRAAEHRMLILVDGFIMTACMLAASRMDEAVLDYAVFGHCGDEGGHRRMLCAMKAEPLLSLGLRLGEGTGALCAYPLVQSAVNMLNEMDTFSHARITKYF